MWIGLESERFLDREVAAAGADVESKVAARDDPSVVDRRPVREVLVAELELDRLRLARLQVRLGEAAERLDGHSASSVVRVRDVELGEDERGSARLFRRESKTKVGSSSPEQPRRRRPCRCWSPWPAQSPRSRRRPCPKARHRCRASRSFRGPERGKIRSWATPRRPRRQNCVPQTTRVSPCAQTKTAGLNSRRVRQAVAKLVQRLDARVVKVLPRTDRERSRHAGLAAPQDSPCSRSSFPRQSRRPD